MNNIPKITISIFILAFFCCSANAQRKKPQYIVVQFFEDRDFTNRDTATRVVDVLIKKNKIINLSRNVFYFKNGISESNFILKVNDQIIDVYCSRIPTTFVLLKVCLNNAAKSSQSELTIKTGDVLVTYGACAMCHKVEIVQIPITEKSGIMTTGIAELDMYIGRFY